ncbi:MAG: DNA polymerase III subunit delta' [Gammaproteobacteria bacterium]|nr:DNA polymerase III subunit delta' [Gammaproteobacteria bacterium]MCW5583085.1 DNA polymerase III subunit delta' [Gammaproteobacteria bacterium]
MIFPWQKEQWQQLLRYKQENRLPHALLFAGAAGIGKAYFAENFIRAQLCQSGVFTQVTGVPADKCECHACRLILGKAHPNVLWVEPEKEESTIKIDQIRHVADFVNQTSLQGECRIVLINPANHMNTNAANALLKTLEEPSAGAIIILISDQISHLLATIRSRCQRILFSRPRKELALEWLQKQLPDSSMDLELVLNLTHGAPLTAMQFATNEVFSIRHRLLQTLCLLQQKHVDPIKAAVTIQDFDLKQLLDFIIAWIMDLLWLKMGRNINKITNKDFSEPLVELNHQTLPINFITQYMNYLQYLRAQLYKGINLNKQLTLESILIRWMECV